MKCPKCEFIQPQSPECINCGLILARFRPEAERQQFVREELTRTMEPEETDPFKRPIRTSMRIIRSVAGVVGLLFGGWLFLAGQRLDLKPHHILLLIGYGCVSLFWVLSTPIKVSVRQFAIEMLIFVSATLLVRVALPEAFELGTLSNKTGSPLHGTQTGQEPSREVTPELFARRVSDTVDNARTVLEDPTDSGLAEAWLKELDASRRMFRFMKRTSRQRCEQLYKGMLALEAAVQRAIDPAAGLRAFEDAFIEVETLERLLLQFPK